MVGALLEGARAGLGGALLFEGAAGTGKTALIHEALRSAGDFHTIRMSGVPAERRMPHAGLHRLVRLVSSTASLAVASETSKGPLSIGLALLDEFHQLASIAPVVLVVDDAQWIDDETCEVLGVVARRLSSLPVAALTAARPTRQLRYHFAGIGVMKLDNLAANDALTVIERHSPVPVAESVAATLTSLAAGNPAHLIALTSRLTADQLSGNDPLPELIVGPNRHTGTAAEMSPAEATTINLLGRFAITRGESAIDMREGVAATALKVVALRGEIPSEELEEILWPGAEPGVGRVRMRNVLHRIRETCGELVERDGRVLRLAAGVQVDAHLFEEQARKAFAGYAVGNPQAPMMALEAAALYRGELLPVDRHADWTAAARERCTRLHLAVLEVLEADAFDRGDLSEALRIVEIGIEVDPFDEDRYTRAARVFAERGRPAIAVSLLRRAKAVMEEFGLGSAASIEGLLAELSQRKDPPSA